jgi:hypothetical protein
VAQHHDTRGMARGASHVDTVLTNEVPCMSVSLPVICSTGRSLQGLVLPARASMNGTETVCVASQIDAHIELERSCALLGRPARGRVVGVRAALLIMQHNFLNGVRRSTNLRTRIRPGRVRLSSRKVPPPRPI